MKKLKSGYYVVTTKLPTPKNTTAYVLQTILNKGCTTEQDMRMNGYRARISDLRNKYKVPVDFKEKHFINRLQPKTKTGKPNIEKCHIHYLKREAIQDAIKIYHAINK